MNTNAFIDYVKDIQNKTNTIHNLKRFLSWQEMHILDLCKQENLNVTLVESLLDKYDILECMAITEFSLAHKYNLIKLEDLESALDSINSFTDIKILISHVFETHYCTFVNPDDFSSVMKIYEKNIGMGNRYSLLSAVFSRAKKFKSGFEFINCNIQKSVLSCYLYLLHCVNIKDVILVTSAIEHLMEAAKKHNKLSIEIMTTSMYRFYRKILQLPDKTEYINAVKTFSDSIMNNDKEQQSKYYNSLINLLEDDI